MLIFIHCHLALFNLPGLFEDFASNLDSALPIALNYDHHDSPVQTWITEKINEFYFGNSLSKEKEKNVTNVRNYSVNLVKEMSYECLFDFTFNM